MRREANSLIVSCRPADSGGWTLIELIAVCAVVATLATLSIPSFREIALNARRTEQVNALLHGLYVARNAAIQRNAPVVLCKSADGLQCAPALPAWSEGWIVFENRDRDSPPMVDTDEAVLLRQPAVENLTIRANRDAVTYWPVSMAGTTVSFTFCDAREAAGARGIIVSATGRPRTSDRDSSGKPWSCE